MTVLQNLIICLTGKHETEPEFLNSDRKYGQKNENIGRARVIHHIVANKLQGGCHENWRQSWILWTTEESRTFCI